jgi:hypothetical protein
MPLHFGVVMPLEYLGTALLLRTRSLLPQGAS